jgi:RNA polymerase sigma factor (sigma-70 family)
LIGELPPQCRRIFLLHKVQHLSYAEIAERLAISPRTVEKQISKALKILRDRMPAS